MTREELPQETPREDMMREALKHYEELATKACWHRSDIPEAIRAYYAPLPPAEGAEEILRQRDELKEAMIDMVNQFAYRGTYEGRENMHTGGLSALEDAFAALGLSDPITLIDFYAAIKSTER